MATTSKHDIGKWDTFHNNGPYPTKTLYKTSLAGKASMPAAIDRYNDAAVEIQRLLKDALDKKEGFRAYGSGWSLSSIAHNKDNMHFNANMNIKRAITPNELHSNSSFKSENLFFFQCGNSIKEVNQFLFENGKSLKTTGASNGQTIAGAVSTGVHGSALDTGAIQDSVVGLNLIIGPGPDDIVYLERSSQPAATDGFAQSIKARIIRDDNLFNAALVGLGAFGFLHGLMFEAEGLFLLKRYVRKVDKQIAMQLATSMDFENSTFNIPGETGPDGKPNRPYHFKVFVNPYVNDSNYVVEFIYKKPFETNYPDPIPNIKTAIYRDLIVLFTKIAEKHKDSIPKLIKMLQSAVLPAVDHDTTGTLGETFWDTSHQGPAFACAVGVSHTDSKKALDLLTHLTKTEGPIPGIYALRFVKQSQATLACTKFPITCMLEIDGLIWKPKNNDMISLERFCERIVEVLTDAQIPFTLHWGKNAAWGFAGLVQTMYGNKANEWNTQRLSFLSPEAAEMFSNGLLREAKLG